MSQTARRRRDGRGEPAGAEPPAPLAEVLELLAGESAASRAFLGGVMLGALVGAALAGTSFLRNRGPGRRTRP